MRWLFLVLLLFVTPVWAEQDAMVTAATGWLKAISTAHSWADVLPFVSEDSADAIAALPGDNKERVFTFYQKLQAEASRGEMEVVERNVVGDRATLVLQAVGARASDGFQGQKINLVREHNGWKVDIAKLVRAMGH